VWPMGGEGLVLVPNSLSISKVVRGVPSEIPVHLGRSAISGPSLYSTITRWRWGALAGSQRQRSKHRWLLRIIYPTWRELLRDDAVTSSLRWPLQDSTSGSSCLRDETIQSRGGSSGSSARFSQTAAPGFSRRLPLGWRRRPRLGRFSAASLSGNRPSPGCCRLSVFLIRSCLPCYPARDPGLRKMRHRGLPKVEWQFTLAITTCDLVRLPKSRAEP